MVQAPGCLPREVFGACPTGRRPRDRPRTRWRDYISQLAWERLGVLLEELVELAGKREVWASLHKLLPPRPELRIKRMIMDGWMARNSIETAANGSWKDDWLKYNATVMQLTLIEKQYVGAMKQTVSFCSIMSF